MCAQCGHAMELQHVCERCGSRTPIDDSCPDALSTGSQLGTLRKDGGALGSAICYMESSLTNHPQDSVPLLADEARALLARLDRGCTCPQSKRTEVQRQSDKRITQLERRIAKLEKLTGVTGSGDEK